jgi:pilus assembly protein CpaE
MKMSDMLLCIDSCIIDAFDADGLGVSSLLDELQVDVCFDAESSRREAMKFCESGSVWVCPVTDMAAINLAASLKADGANNSLQLFIEDPSGSDRSRANAAGIENVENLKDLPLELNKLRPPDKCADLQKADQSSNYVLDQQVELGAVSNNAEFDKESRAFKMTVLSGSGGVGKSAFSTVAAWKLSQKGYKTLLIDCDLQFGDIHSLSNNAVIAEIDDVVSAPAKLTDLLSLASQNGSPVILRAPQRLELSESVGKAIDDVVDMASGMFDVVLANTASNWADYHASLLETTSVAVFLMDQRASSVKACRHAVSLCERLGVATRSFIYALNRCEKGAMFSSLDVSCALDGAKVFELRDGGDSVEELLGAGRASDLVITLNDFVLSVDELLCQVVPPLSGGEQRKGGFALDEKGWSGVAASSNKKSRRRRSGKHAQGVFSGSFASGTSLRSSEKYEEKV